MAMLIRISLKVRFWPALDFHASGATTWFLDFRGFFVQVCFGTREHASEWVARLNRKPKGA